MSDGITRRALLAAAGAVALPLKPAAAGAAAVPLMPAAAGAAPVPLKPASASDWYASCYRKLFFDFHSHSTTAGLASAFNAEKWAQQVEAANAQAVSVCVKCGRGWSYYRKGSVRLVHPQLPAELDLLGEQVGALHKRGIRTIGYYETFKSELLGRQRPEWLTRDATGAPRDTDSLCLIGPLVEQHLLPHLAEIASLYEVDALFFDGTYAKLPCYCESCKARFQAFAGAPIPAKTSNPLWTRYVEWFLAEHRNLRERMSATLHKVRPGMAVSFNWAWSVRQPEPVPDYVTSLVGDIAPADDQVFSASYHARYWVTTGKPFDCMNSAFLQWWGDWGCKPAAAIEQELAPAIANGGLTWIGYQMSPSFEVEPAVMEQMGEALAFVKRREHLLAGAKPVPNVAILHTSRAHLAPHMANAKPGLRADETALRGAHRLFLEAGMPHHILGEGTLAHWLPDCRAVVLPDVRYVPEQLVEALPKWIEGGGVLLATFRSGTENAEGKPLARSVLAEMLSVEIERDCEKPEAYIEVTDAAVKRGALNMPHLVHAPFAFGRPVAPGVEVVAKLRRSYLRSDGNYYLKYSPAGEDSGFPAITRRRLGKGSAIWIAGEVFTGFHAYGQWNLRPIVANLVRLGSGARPLVEVESPVWLEVSVMRQGGRTLVHLVNQQGGRTVLDRGAGVDRNNAWPEQILPVPGVTVHLACASRPRKVTLEPEGTTVQWSYRDGVLRVPVPEVHIHRAVSVLD